MRVLVACESSGRVRSEFRARGHNAWSCDLLPAEDGSAFHIQGDVLKVLKDGWDLMIAHPPCTHLAVSGARWFRGKINGEQAEALKFVCSLLDAPIPKIGLENPVSIISTRIRKPNQIIQPWYFGDPYFKKTCLWLKGLPFLHHTNVLIPPLKGTEEHKKWSFIHRASPGPNRSRERSRTFPGIAQAMAKQWGAT